MQEALFYGFRLERHVPDDHLLRKIGRFVDLSKLWAHLWPYHREVRVLDRSRTDDAHADRRLPLRYSPGASVLQGGPPQSYLPLVLSFGARRRRSRSLDVFQEPPWPLSREQISCANCLIPWWRTLHEGEARRRRGLRGRRQHDRGRGLPQARRRRVSRSRSR